MTRKKPAKRKKPAPPLARELDEIRRLTNELANARREHDLLRATIQTLQMKNELLREQLSRERATWPQPWRRIEPYCDPNRRVGTRPFPGPVEIWW